ncbi:MAG TPA: helix-turn-helix transcriptional regulator [Gemmatimonadaceae bacterium]|nr:helix-turn-helix transcriptional regulator [Gemmatimonadaceae bacterium]
MSITLSTKDLAQIEAALNTLVSPLYYERIGDWRNASRLAVERVIGADRSAGMLPCVDEPLAEHHADLLPAINDYLDYFHTLDVGLQVRRRELGLEVCHWSTVYDMKQLVKSEIYNDFSHPHKMLDCTGLVYDLDPALPPAALLYYHESEKSRPFGERGLALLRLLMPAFKAGVQSCLRLATRRAALGQLFDSIESALACFDAAGNVVQQNLAMTKLLSAEPEHDRLLAQMRAAANTLGASLRRATRHAYSDTPASPWRDLSTAARHYRLSASLLPAGLLAPQSMIVVALDPLDQQQRSDTELRATYALTSREIQIARLLATRHHTPEIADLLGISVHTARRHTEHVLMKLGVHSREQVKSLLFV